MPLFPLPSIEVIVGIISAIATLFGFLYGFYKKIWKPVKTKATHIIKNIEEIPSLRKEVTGINNELKFNGGSSLKDMVAQIHSRIIMSEQFDRAFLHTVQYGISQTDMNGEITWVNRYLERMLGKSIEQLQGRGWINSIALVDREKIVDEWFAAVADRREFNINATYIDSDGYEKKALIQAFLMKDPKGKLLGYMGTVIPIVVVAQ